MAGVIVRSAANIEAGAKTRWSAVCHGTWILVLVAGMPGVLRMIPTSSLAAILVYTGYKVIDVKAIRELWKYGWGEVVIYSATVAVIVIDDLFTGVVVGIVLTASKLLYTFSHLAVAVDSNTTDGKTIVSIRGAATFLRLPRLATVLEQLPPGSEVHYDLDRLSYIDHACLDLLMNWSRQHEATGGKVVIDWDGLHARNGRSSRTDSRLPESPLSLKPVVEDEDADEDSKRRWA